MFVEQPRLHRFGLVWFGLTVTYSPKVRLESCSLGVSHPPVTQSVWHQFTLSPMRGPIHSEGFILPREGSIAKVLQKYDLWPQRQRSVSPMRRGMAARIVWYGIVEHIGGLSCYKLIPAGCNKLIPAGCNKLIPAGCNKLISAGCNIMIPAGCNKLVPVGCNKLISAGCNKLIPAWCNKLIPAGCNKPI